MLTLDDVARLPIEQRLARLGSAPDEYATVLAGPAAADLVRRPDAKNWAPVEVVCHVRDTEELFMARFQTVLAMDAPPFLPADPDRWAEERQYLRNDAGDALAAFRRRRQETLDLLRSLSEAQWQRAGVHPVRGRMTVGELAGFAVWHDANHLEQLRRAARGEP